MAQLTIRWSEAEARKPYARPFGVVFDCGSETAAVAVNGPDLLYYRQLQAAILTLLGEVFIDPEVEASDDPQRHWLDRLSLLLPSIPAEMSLQPVSGFDDTEGRRFALRVVSEGVAAAMISPEAAIDYQLFQADVAHQSGRLFRSLDVEEIADPLVQQRRWVEELASMVQRPAADERLVADWPFS